MINTFVRIPIAEHGDDVCGCHDCMLGKKELHGDDWVHMIFEEELLITTTG